MRGSKLSKPDVKMNQVFKMPRLSGPVLVEVISHDAKTDYYDLRVIEGNGTIPVGDVLIASSAGMKYATLVTGSIQK